MRVKVFADCKLKEKSRDCWNKLCLSNEKHSILDLFSINCSDLPRKQNHRIR